MDYRLTGVAPDFSKRDWELISACIRITIHVYESRGLPFEIENLDELKETLRKVDLKCNG